jgi:hypothetical protein
VNWLPDIWRKRTFGPGNRDRYLCPQDTVKLMTTDDTTAALNVWCAVVMISAKIPDKIKFTVCQTIDSIYSCQKNGICPGDALRTYDSPKSVGTEPERAKCDRFELKINEHISQTLKMTQNRRVAGLFPLHCACAFVGSKSDSWRYKPSFQFPFRSRPISAHGPRAAVVREGQRFFGCSFKTG